MSFEGGGRVRPLTVHRSATARRMRLAVDPRDGAVRLTLPRRASLSAATAWAETHRDWIESSLARLPAPRPFLPGATLPLEGREVAIAWDAAHPRSIRREDDRLIVGGPAELIAARLLRWLRAEALARLSEDSHFYAERAGVSLGRIAVGDPRTRWGSCAASGDLRYSWRLILAPAEVRRATAAHEVAHRLHMHHGPAFHAELARLFGREPGAERAWLKRNGAALYWVGRAG
ncbi:M48 family metallopeptidase [Sphingomonas quercus]|uniref:M48 family metallopeptidase n=1 Tax=Sphingomonas quercus TaxID=2842451 RepID=UPI00343974FE